MEDVGERGQGTSDDGGVGAGPRARCLVPDEDRDQTTMDTGSRGPGQREVRPTSERGGRKPFTRLYCVGEPLACRVKPLYKGL